MSVFPELIFPTKSITAFLTARKLIISINTAMKAIPKMNSSDFMVFSLCKNKVRAGTGRFVLYEKAFSCTGPP